MERTISQNSTDAELEAEMERMLAQITSELAEIKAKRERGSQVWREAQEQAAINKRMLQEIGEILRQAR